MIEIKDFITFASVIVALVSVIYGVTSSRKSVYINAVTTSRLLYMNNLRNHVSEFCGSTLHVVHTYFDGNIKQELLEKVERLRFVIKLHLNRTNKIEIRLIDSLDKIVDLTDPAKITELEKELDLLIKYTQDVLSLEWAGIKEEAYNGRLSIRQKEEFNKKYMPRYLSSLPDEKKKIIIAPHSTPAHTSHATTAPNAPQRATNNSHPYHFNIP